MEIIHNLNNLLDILIESSKRTGSIFGRFGARNGVCCCDCSVQRRTALVGCCEFWCKIQLNIERFQGKNSALPSL
jgi:hypothetical protein